MFDEDETTSIATKCIEEGPGSEMNFYYDIITYSLQIILIWCAFIRLPCSVQKGAPKFRYETVQRQNQANISLILDNSKQKLCQVNCKRGGILQCMLIWDIFSFLIATGIFVFTFQAQPYDLSWKNSTPYLFFAKFIYGLLSLPFLIFAVPIISNLLTKSKATAYDQYGNCVPHSQNVDLQYSVPEDEIFLAQAKIDIDNLQDDDQQTIKPE
ncbi:hypothetical protein PPERSA_00794 [Pseudocohnilembus persalinus]|uniref:Transmembrane protein n=1 Tax=Pseudocohnilembus persalinus TaxID=266149 RepID=A0A0V0QFQ5_PSEPJ|nr:hypothetical protein PPERSA_00794 [Pseudocohnilembus persalinus]|eukprot:KRX01046.1 hypothetical protein PPERSA_00794 [Pseudocohnilembus persalinus]